MGTKRPMVFTVLSHQSASVGRPREHPHAATLRVQNPYGRVVALKAETVIDMVRAGDRFVVGDRGLGAILAQPGPCPTCGRQALALDRTPPLRLAG